MGKPALAELHPFLKPVEKERLTELEVVIERGLSQVGSALREIRDERLYRETHRTFEAYCEERWEMSHRHANRKIQAAKVIEVLGPMGPVLPSERQARELAPLLDEPQQVQDAWQEATESNAEPTAASVREVVQRKMGVHYSSETPEWSTPQDLYDALNEEFGFDLDVCATDENAKAASWFTEKEDGLTQPWTGVCWMNPPYGDEIKHWVKKAHDSAQNGATVVCLVPARVDTGWWWDYCRYGEIRILRGRLKFGGGATGAPFPSAVVIFGPEVRPNALDAHWERSA